MHLRPKMKMTGQSTAEMLTKQGLKVSTPKSAQNALEIMKLGSEFNADQKYEKAIRSFKAALKFYTLQNQTPATLSLQAKTAYLTALNYEAIADSQDQKANCEEALHYLEMANTIAQKSVPELLPYIKLRSGIAHEILKHQQMAKHDLEAAYHDLEQIEQRDEKAEEAYLEANLHLGLHWYKAHNYLLASTYLDKAVKDISNQAKFEKLASTVYELHGITQYRLDHYDVSIASLQKSLALIGEKTPLNEKSATIHEFLGLNYFRQNDVANATPHLKEAQTYFKAHNKTKEMIYTLFIQGLCYLKTNNIPAANLAMNQVEAVISQLPRQYQDAVSHLLAEALRDQHLSQANLSTVPALKAILEFGSIILEDSNQKKMQPPAAKTDEKEGNEKTQSPAATQGQVKLSIPAPVTTAGPTPIGPKSQNTNLFHPLGIGPTPPLINDDKDTSQHKHSKGISEIKRNHL